MIESVANNTIGKAIADVPYPDVYERSVDDYMTLDAEDLAAHASVKPYSVNEP